MADPILRRKGSHRAMALSVPPPILGRMGVLPRDGDWTWEGMMRMRIKAMEAHLRARGRDVERAYLLEGQESHDGAGWEVRVDGDVVATGVSIGSLEVALRRWMASRCD